VRPGATRRKVRIEDACSTQRSGYGAAELEHGLDILLTGLTATLTPPGQARADLPPGPDGTLLTG
jgi:hypothetical protein